MRTWLEARCLLPNSHRDGAPPHAPCTTCHKPQQWPPFQLKPVQKPCGHASCALSFFKGPNSRGWAVRIAMKFLRYDHRCMFLLNSTHLYRCGTAVSSVCGHVRQPNSTESLPRLIRKTAGWQGGSAYVRYIVSLSLILCSILAAKYVPGMYAVRVSGRIPEDVEMELERRGIKYRPRDGTDQE